LCINCGEVLRFDDSLALVVAAPSDRALLGKEQLAMMDLAQKLIRDRGRIK
jgi:hypothetical protein